MPNVEDNELFYPFLYLWRKELPDSGGAGKFRGGNSAELALVPHKTDVINLFTITSELAVPGPGLFGGYPSSTNKYALVQGREGARADRGQRPHAHRPDRARRRGRLGAREVLRPSARRRTTSSCVRGPAASGYGDPLDREPQRVADDVAAGRVTRRVGREGIRRRACRRRVGGHGRDRGEARGGCDRRDSAEGRPWDGPEEEQ